MNVEALVDRLLADSTYIHQLDAPLPAAEASVVVERLKQEADRFWTINANRSLELAELIVQIGQQRADQQQIALGIMARGDALKLLGRNTDAWDALQQAGDLFVAVGDEVGWARTRIGRLGICVELGCPDDALADVEQALEIFTRHAEHERRLRVALNLGVVYDQLGDHRRALEQYNLALSLAQSLDQTSYIPGIYTNMGYAYDMLGDFQAALSRYEQAQTLFAASNATSVLALVNHNIAHIEMLQGRYRRALNLLHQALAMLDDQLPRERALIQRVMVECYLLLGRPAEARRLAQRTAALFHEFGAVSHEADVLLHLAQAEAELHNFVAAEDALNQAEIIFTHLRSAAWLAMVQLRRSRVALAHGNIDMAYAAAVTAISAFDHGGQQVQAAHARLMLGEVALQRHELVAATDATTQALHTAQQCNVSSLRYNAHLLLGHIAAQRNDTHRAMRHYRAAATVVDRVQRCLTITLRPGFLEDRGAALQSLLALHLRAGAAVAAWTTLERAKSQVFLGYLTNRDQLRWTHDERSASLLNELNRLRGEHQWYYRAAHEPQSIEAERRGSITPEQALEEVARRERRMRAITEQLYLQHDDAALDLRPHLPSLAEIQRQLDPSTLLIEFYADDSNVWAFTLDEDSIELHSLPIHVAELQHLSKQLSINLNAALKVAAHSLVAQRLTPLGQRTLQRLYNGLLEPLLPRIADHQRLVIVPYGLMHYLPLHLLHDGSGYLIERCEIVVSPTASLLTRAPVQRGCGARVLAHSWGGKLPHTQAEAQLVGRFFSSEMYTEEAAVRDTLHAAPTQILHIAAHGQYRLDQPDLSYLLLADGQVYTDDLLQHDLSYELVTLSACETGRVSVSAGDELIGLGRGFLYAGAGALLTSMWQIPDDSTLHLMDQFYQQLHAGATKAAALRQAQRTLLAADRLTHPAFWGAFQLIGDAGSLAAPAHKE